MRSSACHVAGRLQRQLRSATFQKKVNQKREQQDVDQSSSYPGLEYASQPESAPVVSRAIDFFGRVHGMNSCQEHTLGGKVMPIYLGDAKHWRSTAKMAVRGGLWPTIGMFRPGSHQLIECLDHPAHEPVINEALVHVSRALRAVGVGAYDESDGTGEIKFVVVRSAGDIDDDGRAKAEVSLIWNTWQKDQASIEQEKREKVERVVENLLRGSKDLWQSLWLHSHEGSKDDGSVYSFTPNSWQHLYGQRFARRRLVGQEEGCLHFLPSVFRQANLSGFERLIGSIRQRILPGSPRVVELYGGVGMIGLNIVDLSASLCCSDENPDNTECFEQSLGSLPAELAGRAHYVPLAAAEMVKQGHVFTSPFEVLVVNPPRKGLDPEVVRALSSPPSDFHPQQIIYVSCSLKTLINDLSSLQQRWLVTHAEGHLLFPGTNHIELLVVLHRR